MAHICLYLLALLFTVFNLPGTVEPAPGPPTMGPPMTSQQSTTRAYLETQCRVTRYPTLCVECLSAYSHTESAQGPQQLAQIALTVALTKARYTKAYVSAVAKNFDSTKDRDLQVVNDCLNQVNDGVDQITQSIREIRRMGKDGEEKFIWHESNIQSWISAALTDATMCMEGFSGRAVGGKVKATIKAKVLNVAQLASNALALFNRFASRHRSSHALNNP